MKSKILVLIAGLLALCSCGGKIEEANYPKQYKFGDYSQFVKTTSDYIVKQGVAGYEILWILTEYDADHNIVATTRRTVDESFNNTVTLTANDKSEWICANLHADLFGENGKSGELDYYSYPMKRLAAVRDFAVDLTIKTGAVFSPSPKFD